MQTEPLAPAHVARRLATRRHGVVAGRELHAAGLTPRQVQRLRRSSVFTALSDEVLMVAGAPVTLDAQLAAAALDAGDGSMLSDFTAAARWGLSGCPLRPFTIATTSSTRRSSQLGTVRRVRRLPSDWCTELDALPILRPEFLAVRLFALCRPARAEILTDRLWSMRLLSGPSLLSFVDDMGARGRNGIGGLREYLERRGPTYLPSATNLESRVRQILRDAGIDVRPQVDAGGERWTGRVDFRVVRAPVIIEVQSQAFHSALVDQSSDAERIAALREAGFVVVEVWDTVVWSDPAEVVRLARAAISSARP